VDEQDTTRSVYRVELNGRKPMTLDEALLEIGPERDHMVFLDADTQKTTVLVRRRDGNFELIEA
jgi:hypothetical protein